MTGGNRKLFIDAAHREELKVMQKPSWAESSEKPLFTAAWASDMHIGSGRGNHDRTKIGLNQLRDELKPDVVFITGDNNASSNGLPKRYSKLSENERRQWYMRLFLERELSRPYIIIPGDNWPWDFEKVFGSTVFSMDCGGYHLVFAATDAKANGNDSCAVFYEDTKEWLKGDLENNRDKPCLFFMHETAYPPMFLDAPWLSDMLDNQPHVLACLSGHLHCDLELARKGWKQFVIPGMSHGEHPAFKMMSFYHDKVVFRNWEWNSETKHYAAVDKWQRIEIPEGLRPRPSQKGLIVNMRNMPVRPKTLDQELLERSKEIDMGLMKFVTEYGIGKFFGR